MHDVTGAPRPRQTSGATAGARAGAGVLGTDSSALRHPAVLALGLLLVAGYVDAFVFLRVAEVFTANQSGNLVVAGIALGSHPGEGTVLPLVAVTAYVLGAGLSVALFDGHDGGRRRIVGVLATLIGVLVGLILLLESADMGHRRGGVRWVVYLTVALAALAMGSQATAVRQVGAVPVLTTAGSGAVTNLGVSLARLGPRGARQEARTAAGLLALTTSAYVGGAALGALACTRTELGPPLLVVPIAVLVAMMALPLTSRRSA
jgi:uncharacterized membrane protein YoaK (UPF0700 family)